MDNIEKARNLINKHLYLHGGDGLGINDGNVYRAVLDAVCEALTIPVVSGSSFDDTKELLKKLTYDERMDLFEDYCKYCGDPNPSCQCWNDE